MRRLGILLAASLFLLACNNQEAEQAAIQMTGGDPARGRTAIQWYGCASCHSIPRVEGANGLVGPPLDNIASRNCIGGVLVNAPDNMIRWLKNPPAVDPRTAMPDLHIKEEDLPDIAAYLYTLR